MDHFQSISINQFLKKDIMFKILWNGFRSSIWIFKLLNSTIIIFKAKWVQVVRGEFTYQLISAFECKPFISRSQLPSGAHPTHQTQSKHAAVDSRRTNQKSNRRKRRKNLVLSDSRISLPRAVSFHREQWEVIYLDLPHLDNLDNLDNPLKEETIV